MCVRMLHPVKRINYQSSIKTVPWSNFKASLENGLHSRNHANS